ncbi:unnamed protein product [Ambrosiozyma monospora]|uniref:Unnamed protein product n=1 Tax=Ambrosiozyma monospora TaxID=43982 RepID=A0ACB5TCF6_AMBMO|nr:unnamed protein product [Ambrosiozyma monospora]
MGVRLCVVLAEWLSHNSNCYGLDLGFNDLSSDGKLKPFVEFGKLKKDNNIALVSLSNCNLKDDKLTSELFDTLSKFKHLKYFDVSGNKSLFPKFLDKLSVYLPFFKYLTVLHLDENNLDDAAIVKLCEVVPFVPSLNYLFLTGNKLSEASQIAICRMIDNAKSLFSVAFDKDQVELKYQERIGLLTMRNMELALYGKKPDSVTTVEPGSTQLPTADPTTATTQATATATQNKYTTDEQELISALVSQNKQRGQQFFTTDGSGSSLHYKRVGEIVCGS